MDDNLKIKHKLIDYAEKLQSDLRILEELCKQEKQAENWIAFNHAWGRWCALDEVRIKLYQIIATRSYDGEY